MLADFGSISSKALDKIITADWSIHFINGIAYIVIPLYIGFFHSIGKFSIPISFCFVSLTANNLNTHVTAFESAARSDIPVIIEESKL